MGEVAKGKKKWGFRTGGSKGGEKPKFSTGELWKAQQLKEYRRIHGLCFKCGEKYSPNHQCAQLLAAQVNVVETIDHKALLSDEMLEAVMDVEDIGQDPDMFLSLNALAGWGNTGTIHLRALVQNQVLPILVDSGSSHSFLNSHLVEKLQLPVRNVPTMTVKIANGQQMSCQQMVHNFEWWIQGKTFSHDMRVLDLGGYDAILGIDWLVKFSPMTCNWVDKWVSFVYKGDQVQLQGFKPTVAQPLPLQAVLAEQLLKWHQGNEIWVVAVVQPGDKPVVSSYPAEVQHLIDKYSMIFQTPSVLPPQRSFDHAVTLLPNTAPVNTRPYRYSPAQKD